jgi:hypothetical protein
MSEPRKVIVVHDDPRAAQGVRLGFEREGLEVTAGAVDAIVGELAGAGVVVAGASDGDAARALLARLVTEGATRGAPPVLYVGNGISRADALAAGASAFLGHPAYLRDVVTIGRILAGRRPGNRAVMDGDLGASFGVFYLVRALAAIGATGTLLMTRGLRRGEIRFFEGEVTSAQVGGLHGQGALHQLLLWTEARFELREEPVVRRQQIPLSCEELLAGAERFLLDMRAVAGVLSPSAIYELDHPVLQRHAKAVPTEVHGVLRLFDGHRTVADALEDSAYRMFETLRIAERAAQVGILRRRDVGRPRTPHRAMLALEEWLVGGSGAVATPIVPEGSGGVGGGKKGKGKKGKSGTEPRGPAVVEVDWAALVPRSIGLDTGALSPVVPSAIIAGEITTRPSRGSAREGLEGLTDAEERDRLFPPTSISVDLGALEREAKAEAEAKVAAKAKAEEDAKAKAKAEEDAKAKAKAEEDAKAKAKAKRTRRRRRRPRRTRRRRRRPRKTRRRRPRRKKTQRRRPRRKRTRRPRPRRKKTRRPRRRPRKTRRRRPRRKKTRRPRPRRKKTRRRRRRPRKTRRRRPRRKKTRRRRPRRKKTRRPRPRRRPRKTRRRRPRRKKTQRRRPRRKKTRRPRRRPRTTRRPRRRPRKTRRRRPRRKKTRRRRPRRKKTRRRRPRRRTRRAPSVRPRPRPRARPRRPPASWRRRHAGNAGPRASCRSRSMGSIPRSRPPGRASWSPTCSTPRRRRRRWARSRPTRRRRLAPRRRGP